MYVLTAVPRRPLLHQTDASENTELVAMGTERAGAGVPTRGALTLKELGGGRKRDRIFWNADKINGLHDQNKILRI